MGEDNTIKTEDYVTPDYLTYFKYGYSVLIFKQEKQKKFYINYEN